MGLCLETKGTEYFIWSLCIVCSCYHEETSLKCSRKLSIHKSTAAMWKQAVKTSQKLWLIGSLIYQPKVFFTPSQIQSYNLIGLMQQKNNKGNDG